MMRVKVLILGLILFLSFLCCKSPVSPDIPLRPTIEYFRANPSQVSYGESSTLSWSTANAWRVVIECDDDVKQFRPGIAVVEKTGTMEVWPERTTIYTLVASGAGEPVEESIEVEVIP